MGYKALMLDLDGTLIPYDYDALPSKKVISAVKEARKRVHISLVTGRALHTAIKIATLLDCKEGFLVINNGAQVFDIKAKSYVYSQPIAAEDMPHILRILQEEQIAFYIKDDTWDKLRHYQEGQKIVNPYMIFTDDVLSDETAARITSLLHAVTNLTIHKTHHRHADKYALNISHINATKLHGIHVVQKQLGITQKETIGVGDSYNDFPLLMASGLKVAMGNAVSDLKAIADVIAPPVTEDGVAWVIEKYILQKS